MSNAYTQRKNVAVEEKSTKKEINKETKLHHERISISSCNIRIKSKQIEKSIVYRSSNAALFVFIEQQPTEIVFYFGYD